MNILFTCQLIRSSKCIKWIGGMWGNPSEEEPVFGSACWLCSPAGSSLDAWLLPAQRGGRQVSGLVCQCSPVVVTSSVQPMSVGPGDWLHHKPANQPLLFYGIFISAAPFDNPCLEPFTPCHRPLIYPATSASPSAIPSFLTQAHTSYPAIH